MRQINVQVSIIRTGTRSLATVESIAGSLSPAEMSFTMLAPALIASSATCALVVSIEMGIWLCSRMPLIRQHARELFFQRHGRCARTARLATNVDDVDSVALHLQGLCHGGVDSREVRAIAEAIRRDVDDAHDVGPAPQQPRFLFVHRQHGHWRHPLLLLLLQPSVERLRVGLEHWMHKVCTRGTSGRVSTQQVIQELKLMAHLAPDPLAARAQSLSRGCARAG